MNKNVATKTIVQNENCIRKKNGKKKRKEKKKRKLKRDQTIVLMLKPKVI